VRLLRLAGFKIAVHWMPNLLGATPASDRADFYRLWDDPALRPDELKIYPCALLAGTPLHEHWQRGEYRPYDEGELVLLVSDCKALTPPYCRINRVTRDIPAPHIVAGSTRANLRQIVQQNLSAQGRSCRCIRCREVRRQPIEPGSLHLQTLVYPTELSLEYFLSAVTPQGKLAGFLRLSLPRRRAQVALALRNCLDNIVDEIHDCAMIREVHVYGPALAPGAASRGDAQHTGIGSRLITRAQSIARSGGYRRLAVIAATGTRNYYRQRGFQLGELYMAKDIAPL
jgi:elongator complex protein 3